MELEHEHIAWDSTEQPAAQEGFNKVKLGKKHDKRQGLEAITRNTSLQLA